MLGLGSLGFYLFSMENHTVFGVTGYIHIACCNYSYVTISPRVKGGPEFLVVGGPDFPYTALVPPSELVTSMAFMTALFEIFFLDGSSLIKLLFHGFRTVCLIFIVF